MTKTVSVSEAKNQLSAMMRWAKENTAAVIVESRGEPEAVILSYAEYQELVALREQERRREALRKLEELAEEIWARNADLTDDEVEELSEEISQETIQRMISEGKVRYQS